MKTLTLLAGAAFGLGLLHPAAVHADQTVRCESRNGQYQACSANTSGGVTLSRQLSSQGCWQGDTWGYDRNRIWVTRGCRADFRIGGGSSSGGSSDNTGKVVAGAIVLGVIAAAIAASNKDKHDDRYDDYNDYDDHQGNWGGPDYTFTCESRDERFTRCSNGQVRGRGHVEIVRRLSKSDCRYGESWGVDRNQVWVDHGCRAEFGVYR